MTAVFSPRRKGSDGVGLVEHQDHRVRVGHATLLMLSNTAFLALLVLPGPWRGRS
jgi:hypothetical protein